MSTGVPRERLRDLARISLDELKMRDGVALQVQAAIDAAREASDVVKAQKPLAAAEVVVEEVAGNPGYYTSKFFLRPHYQLEGLTVSLRLVSKLPSQKQ